MINFVENPLVPACTVVARYPSVLSAIVEPIAKAAGARLSRQSDLILGWLRVLRRRHIHIKF